MSYWANSEVSIESALSCVCKWSVENYVDSSESPSPLTISVGVACIQTVEYRSHGLEQGVVVWLD